MAEKLVGTLAGKMTITLQTDYLYHREDCWVAVENATVRVGLTEYVLKRFGAVVILETLPRGSTVKQGREIGKVETLKATVTILSPVKGTIIEVNSRLSPRPYVINRDPYGEGWIYRISVPNIEADRKNLLQAEDYLAAAVVKFAERVRGGKR